MDLNALRLFVDIVDAGNLSAAARKLKMTRANVSYRLKALEEELATSEPAHQQAEQRPSGPPPREEELMMLSEELERERRQLKEDEEALMEQMREMEVQMARERAELARQRNELQRLQTDLRHELEMAARDGTLRERLAPMQRRHQDISTRRGAAPGTCSSSGMWVSSS